MNARLHVAPNHVGVPKIKLVLVVSLPYFLEVVHIQLGQQTSTCLTKDLMVFWLKTVGNTYAVNRLGSLIIIVLPSVDQQMIS